MDVVKSLVLRAAAVLLGFAIVLAVAAEARAQVVITIPTTRQAEQLMEYQQMLSGPFHPDSNQMIVGQCGDGPVPISITNGSVSPLRYLQNAGDCIVTLQCDLMTSGSCGTPVGPPITLSPKPTPPFRAFGFACDSSAKAICLTPDGSGDWRLQAVYP